MLFAAVEAGGGTCRISNLIPRLESLRTTVRKKADLGLPRSPPDLVSLGNLEYLPACFESVVICAPV